MLMGAVLLVAQLGSHEIRMLLSSGQKDVKDVLKGLSSGVRKTAPEFFEILAKVPPLDNLKLIKFPQAKQVMESLL